MQLDNMILQGKLSETATVLFVDDEPAMRKIFQDTFSEFKVITAKDAGEALTILESGDDDVGVLLTDYFMPGRLGSVLLTEVQDKWPDIVRLLTTFDHLAATNSVKGGTVFGYVEKPWNMDVLKQQLTEALVEHQKCKNGNDTYVNTMIGEVRTSLKSIKKSVKFFDEYWSFLLNFQLTLSSVNQHHSKMQFEEATILKTMNDTVFHDINKADAVMDILPGLANLETDLKSKFSYCSIQECIENICAVNSFTNSPNFDANNNFAFHGSSDLLSCVISHLISNADDAIETAGKGDISISLERGHRFNQLYFTDSATGINSEELPNIFEYGYTGKVFADGLGLPFCKQIMNLFSGDIRCKSVEGGYTTFILEFPPIVNSSN